MPRTSHQHSHQSPSLVPTSPTQRYSLPLIRTLTLVEDAGDERDGQSNPAAPILLKPRLKFAAHSSQFPPRPRGILSAQLCPLRCAGLHPGLFVPPPCSPHTTQFCLSTKWSSQPLRRLLLAFTGHLCRWMHPRRCAADLKLLPHLARPSTSPPTLTKAFLTGPSGSSARQFGVRIAQNISGDVRRSLAAHHLQSIFTFSSSNTKAKTTILPPTVILPTSSMPSKRLSVMSRSTLSLSSKAVAKGA